jgi:DNA topoisomerase VI subunit B
MPNPDDLKINARPTKEFFISMLIKDIGTTRAIIDLVDNCVDGARNLRPLGAFDGLKVEIDTKKDHFKISDNCGGISIDLAQKYAFRFGRSPEMRATAHSIGQFGVGMKRALFKLGERFAIDSRTQNSRFTMEVDIEEWKKEEEWEFKFKELEPNLRRLPLADTGTSIVVKPLHPTIAESFSSDL